MEITQEKIFQLKSVFHNLCLIEMYPGKRENKDILHATLVVLDALMNDLGVPKAETVEGDEWPDGRDEKWRALG